MTKADYTHLLLIVDRSGSMQIIANDMNGAIASLLDEQAKLPGEIAVDAWAFDTLVEQVASNTTPDDYLLRRLVQPRGSTALFDAVGKAITDLGANLASLAEEHRPGKVVVIIVTDGEENDSREWTKDGVKALLSQQQDQYGWQAVFLGANIDAAAVGGGIGLRGGSSRGYVASAAGVQNVFATTSSLLADYRSGASRSMTYTEDEKTE